MLKCLDKGYIELLEKFGDEKTIVNAARVSYGAKTEEFDAKDEKLMRYLYRNKHMSPFRHVMFRFRINIQMVCERACTIYKWFVKEHALP